MSLREDTAILRAFRDMNAANATLYQLDRRQVPCCLLTLAL